MPITIDDFKVAPDPDRILIATITAGWVLREADFTEVPATNRWTCEWEWNPIKPSAVYQWDGTTLTTLAEQASVANCNSTVESWFYEEDHATGVYDIHVHPTGADITGMQFIIDWPLRLSNKTVNITVGGRAVRCDPCMVDEPVISRAMPLLSPAVSRASASFSIMATYAARILTRGIIWNRPITIEVGGGVRRGTSIEYLDYADYVTRFTGFTSSGDSGGRLALNLDKAVLTIPCVDSHAIYSAIVPESIDAAFTGTASEIIEDAFTAAGLAVPDIETGFDTARPWAMVLGRPAPQPLLRIIQGINGHLCMLLVKTNGDVVLSRWKNPVGSPVAVFSELNDPERGQLDAVLDYSQYASSVTVLLNSGLRGTKMQKNRSEKLDEQTDVLRVTSGWTRWTYGGPPTNTNAWYREANYEVLAVQNIVGGGKVDLDEESSWQSVDTNDVSWCQRPESTVSQSLLFINPTGNADPNTQTYDIHRKVEKKDDTSSNATKVSDENKVAATSAKAIALYGKEADRMVASYIVNVDDAQELADEFAAFCDQPFEEWSFSASLMLYLDIELNDEIELDLEDATVLQLMVREMVENYKDGRCRITAWRPHQAGLD